MPRRDRQKGWQFPLPRRNPGRDVNGVNWRQGRFPCHPTLAREEWEDPRVVEEHDHVAQAALFGSEGRCAVPAEHVVPLMEIAKPAKPKYTRPFEMVRTTERIIILEDDDEPIFVGEAEWEDLYPEVHGGNGKAPQKKLYSEVLVEKPG